VQFLSVGFSTLSLIKGDPRSELVGTANARMALSVFFGKLLFIPSTQKSVPCAGSAADQFPEVQFHIIGPGRTSDALSRSNVHVYGEMKFAETVKYIKHAKFCIAPYRRNEHATYLADTSMKLLQYDFLGFALGLSRFRGRRSSTSIQP
jgi:hypothetical protein